MKSTDFRAAILDLDGVVTQTAKIHARAWKTMFDEYLRQRDERRRETHARFDIDADYGRYVDGKPRHEGVRSFLESRGISLPLGEVNDAPGTESIRGLGNRKNEIFGEALQRDGAEVYEDTIAQIGNWKRDGLKVAVVSSSRNCEAVLKSAHIADLFDATIDGNTVERHGLKGKPAPDIFLHAAEKLGVEPSQAIVVEDAIAGVQAGRAGRFGLVVGVDRDRAGDDLWQAGADRVVHDLRNLQIALHCKPSAKCLQTPSSALEHLDGLANRIRGHALALFLDYDGTLTPIVRRPEEATLSPVVRSLLRELSKHCAVAVISGRDRGNVEAMVQVDNLVYAGSHGFDVRGPGGLEMQHDEARRALPELDEAERKLRQRIGDIEGARVERKRFAIAIHYREVPRDDDVERVEKVVDSVRTDHPGLRKRGGKKVFELQPDVEWDKGYSIMWLAKELGFFRAGAVIIYIGDDVTDEDAFREVRSRGVGVGIRVALPTAGTHAQYYLRDCGEVTMFLKWLLSVLRQQTSTAQRQVR